MGKMMLRSHPRVNRFACALAITVWPLSAKAHVSEMGFVLLMPTELYAAAGTWAVAVTALMLAFLPKVMTKKLFSSLRLWRARLGDDPLWPSLVSCLFLFAVIFIGFAGPRDPLTNLLPLTIWTSWWVIMVLVQGAVIDIWRHLNPWTGLYRILAPARPVWAWPKAIGAWPALPGLWLFAGFLLADPAPDDPDRLALAVTVYWSVIFAGMIVFGEDFLRNAEFFTKLMDLLAELAIIGTKNSTLRVGLPGWQWFDGRIPDWPASLMALSFLAIGSFDGLNETFWWMAQIGINPLMFPGRSAVIVETLAGLAMAHALLFFVFLGAIYVGLRLAGAPDRLDEAFRLLSFSILPIALAYHLAHYLAIILISGQYIMAGLSDPLANGADLFGLGTFYVTTGFLNTRASVEIIFQTQAAAVVIGHVLAVGLAHSMAIRLFSDRRLALLSQLPLSLFMLAYTFLGLWLLAAPKGA